MILIQNGAYAAFCVNQSIFTRAKAGSESLAIFHISQGVKKMVNRTGFRSVIALFTVVGMAVGLVGCMSTGVVPMGRDTYMLSKSGTALSSGATVKASLYREADAWCRKQGLVMVPVSERNSDGVPGVHLANAEITFRAVRSDDYENQRTHMEQRPDTVVEVRNR